MEKLASEQPKLHGEQEFQKDHIQHILVHSLVGHLEIFIRLVRSNLIGKVKPSGGLLAN